MNKLHNLTIFSSLWNLLFKMNTTFVSVRRNHYLRSYAYRFIELCIPTLTESIIRAGVKLLIDAE